MAVSKNLIMSRAFVCANCQRSLRRSARSFATAASPEIFDVTVVGGGPAGLSLLAALRSSPSTAHLKVALIESGNLDKIRSWKLPKDQFSNRASSLTPSSIAYLQSMGVGLDEERLQPYHHMRVWDGLADQGRVSFDAPVSAGPIAYMAENPNITKSLLSRVDEISGVSIMDQTSVTKIEMGPPPDPDSAVMNLSQYPHISLSSNRIIASRLLIGADGINGPVRAFAAIATRGWDYDRHAVVATLKMQDDLSPTDPVTAYQRFLPTGPVALLRLPNNHASLVWTTTPERAVQLKALNEKDFLAMVNAAFRLSMVDIDFMSTQPSGQEEELTWRSSVKSTDDAESRNEIPRPAIAVQTGSIASFPLRLRQATTYKAHRVALIGDAAHSIHPLAGQGLNMGLGDSQALHTAISYAVQHGADIGDELSCLDRYNSDIWMSNNRMLGAVDKLHWLYSTRSLPIVGIRGLGLSLVDRLGGLKHWFMRQAGT